MRTRSTVAPSLLAALALAWPVVLGAAPSSFPDAARTTPRAPDPIIGGEVVEHCGWPAVLAVENPQITCTASLVHPRLLITAAHCGDLTEAHLGERWRNPARTVAISECHRNPGWSSSGSRGYDYEYCLLSEPVTDVPIVPILMGCELDVLSPGREVVAAGFGRTQQDENDYGTKRDVTLTLTSVDWDAGTLWASDSGGKSTCNGDSGGPLYIRLSEALGGDDTWRVFGVNSWTQGGCVNGTGFVLMPQAIPWIEEHSGIDITPCGDADGTWRPSPDCGFFAQEPGTGVGAWPSCEAGPVAGPSSICGPPFAGEDDVAPSVSVLEPADGSRIEPDGDSARVTIRVDADDGDGWGIGEVHLIIDGEPNMAAAKSIPPFEWSAWFPIGEYVLEAVAVDRGGNEGRATTRFGVGRDPPPPGTDSGETDDDGSDDDGSDDDATSDETDDSGAPTDDDRTDDSGIDQGADDTDLAGCGCAGHDHDHRAVAFVALVLATALGRRRRCGDDPDGP